MKLINKRFFLFFLTVAMVMSVIFQACKKEGEDLTLGAAPQANFDVVPGSDANTFILVNKSNQPSIPYWTLNTGQKLSGDSTKVNFVFKGDYDVTLLVAGQGGTSTVTRKINVAQNDPTACNPSNPLGFIAGCTQKKWKLNPEAGAYKVGEGAGNGNWWSSGAGDVTGRSCEFNDEYIFTFDAVGTFVYDNKGDFYGDGYLGNATNGCEPNSNLNATQSLWASGNFKFTVVKDKGVNGLGQLTVTGKGAHIGLQKVHNGGETTSGPAKDFITYDILEMTQNAGGQGYDILKVGTNIGGAGWWTFTLRSY